MHRLIRQYCVRIRARQLCAAICAMNLAIGIAAGPVEGGQRIVPETARIDVSQAKLGDGGIMLYSKPFDGLYIKEGNSERRLNYRHGKHIAPHISPDSKIFLWHSQQGGRLGIWLTDTNRETSERICDGAQAAWSPDGTKLVLVRDGRIIEKQLANGDERTVSIQSYVFCSAAACDPFSRLRGALRHIKGRQAQ